jgi:type VI secretion system secreted protein Hcp
MKINQRVRIIIPLILILGGATIFLVAALSNQQVNASIDESSTFITEAVSMNLWIEGYSGESDRLDREESCDVFAYSHSVTNAYDPDPIRSASEKRHTPLRITKMVDKTTPKLYEACSKVTVIPSATLRFYYEPDGLNFLTIELQNAVIISIQDYGIMEGRPTETVSFVYESVKWTYTEFGLDGKAKGNVEYNDTWQETPP